MPGWEDTKRAAQSAYISASLNMDSSIGYAYQQIVQHGQISPVLGQSDISRQIAEAPYQPTEADWKEYEQYSAAWEKENPPREPTEEEWKEWVRLIGIDPDTPEMG